VIFAIILFSAFAPNVSFAVQSCECFCGKDTEGAVDKGAMTQDKCQSACSKDLKRYIGCFIDSAQYPSQSDRCWTKAECAAWSDEINGEKVTADWGDVFPADCAKTKTTQQEMHYCYANDVPYDLNISIGSVTKVQNFPEYINAVYTWLLPAAALIAVVMMMIGGLQYVLARGKSKYVDAAKTRITNAITGMVILLSIFVILNLIDSQLTVFESLKTPLIKEVVVLDSTSSCEQLEDYGYKIDHPNGTECGDKGTIDLENSVLKNNAIGSWKDGEECDYYSCPLDGFACLSDGTCVACGEIPTPSSETCSWFEELRGGRDGKLFTFCRYDATSNSCMGVTATTEASSFYCPTMQTYSDASKNKTTPACDYYGTLRLVTKAGSEPIGSVRGKDILKEICTEDYCGLAGFNGGTKCVYNEGADVKTYLFGLVTSTSQGYFCHTF